MQLHVLNQLIQIMNYLQSEKKIKQETNGNNAPTVLRKMAGYNQLHIVQWILQKWPKLNLNSAFKKAVIRGHFRMVVYLHQHGADIHIDNEYAIGVAAEYGYL